MFLGHFAVAFAAKRAQPALPLGLLFAAAQLADLLWPLLVLAGIERFEIRPGATAFTPLEFTHYPWSHSLLAMAAAGLVLALGHRAARRAPVAASALLAAVVASHWLLDALSHAPDMPLAPGDGVRVGLGLWNSVAATLAVELALFAAAAWLYVRGTSPRDRIGRWGLAALLAFLAAVYLANAFGPPPPSTGAVAWTALSMWLLVAWAEWVDRHRVPGNAAF